MLQDNLVTSRVKNASLSSANHRPDVRTDFISDYISKKTKDVSRYLFWTNGLWKGRQMKRLIYYLFANIRNQKGEHYKSDVPAWGSDTVTPLSYKYKLDKYLDHQNTSYVAMITGEYASIVQQY